MNKMLSSTKVKLEYYYWIPTLKRKIALKDIIRLCEKHSERGSL